MGSRPAARPSALTSGARFRRTLALALALAQALALALATLTLTRILTLTQARALLDGVYQVDRGDLEHGRRGT